jgi:glutathione peroxidase
MTLSPLVPFLVCLIPLGCSSSAESTSSSVESKPSPPTAESKPSPKETPPGNEGKVSPKETPRANGFYALSAADIDGRQQALSQYTGKVALVVNTASECGFTPQYEGLEKLYSELEPRGFVVLGYPSNDFGSQEPGSATEIKTFCSEKYHVTFPMFAKVVTKPGPEQSPIYDNLGKATGKLPTWNFCKYLVDKNGNVLAFYPSKVKPDDAELRKAIETALAAK